MAIRPTDIRRKEFKSGIRGYDANQVDDFLDAVADEFERNFAENQRLSEEITNLRGRLEQFEQLEDSIRASIVHAEEVSRDLRQNANKEAELIIREAQEQAHRTLADSSGRVERVQESYEALQQAKQEFANEFRYLLKSFLAVMDNADIATAKEIEASLRGRLDLESVAAARQAAETQRSEQEERVEPTGETRGEAQSGDTQRVETVATPGGGTTEHRGGPEPEVEEPEVDPSSVQSPASQERAATQAEQTAPDSTEVAEELDREEPMPAGEGRAYDRFFDEDRTRTEEPSEERKLFRASRFLRRRG
ncbi:MAG: DivIVA domain-containing protein [Actinomycetota bacterium]|nr:DivIVA domain-containing protein [Actinomycetota bacterium]